MEWRRNYKDIILYDNSHISSLRIFSRYDMQLSAHQYSSVQCDGYPSHLANILFIARHMLIIPEMKQSTCAFIVAPCIS